VCDVSEYRKLANYPIGINVGCRHYFISSTVWKATFPLPNFFIIYDIWYPAFLLTRGIKIMQVFVASDASAFPKSLHHLCIHKPYPVVLAGDEDSVCHPIYDTQQFIPFAFYHGLKSLAPFRLIVYDSGKATQGASEYGKDDHPEYRVREWGHKKGTGQKYNEGNHGYNYRPFNSGGIASIGYWNEKQETVYIVNTVEEVLAQDVPRRPVYQFSKIVK